MNINSTNWTHCFYQADQLKAFISIGAELNEDPELLYFVTSTNLEHKEFFQAQFPRLKEAIQDINEKYGHWTFVNAEEKAAKKKDKGTGSCSSCQAH